MPIPDPGRPAYEFGRNKPQAKQRIQASGLDSADFLVIAQGQEFTDQDISLNYPLFIKPTNRGGGLGIDSQSVVHNFEQLKAKVITITGQFKGDALIEQYLAGREFSVAILKDYETHEYHVLPLELIAPEDECGNRILSGKVKRLNVESANTIKDAKLKDLISNFALSCFHSLSARDFGRIDIRLSRSGNPSFLEANLIPSLISGYGSFPKACVLNIGLEHDDMIMNIVKLGLSRSEEKSEIPLTAWNSSAIHFSLN
ncbi:MAG TPA: hypothetical protein VFN31_02410 [Candidatus Saccharimonadales bacterium]|nr:hypothetical protein [Candidatus Saccharimonadales bacterium]